MRTWLALAAHYGEYILHPVESHLQCSCPVFDCGSFEVQKQSVSNAFQYVVLRPVAPSPSDDIPAARGQMQVQNYKIISEYHRIRLRFKLFLTLCIVEESSLLLKENGTGWERTRLTNNNKPCKRGKEACKLGKRYWETGRKVLSGSLPSPALTSWGTRPFMLERTAESDFYSLALSFFGKYSQRRLSRTFHRRG